MGHNWCAQRIREHFLPFKVFKHVLEATLSEPGWLVFLIFTWSLMTRRDNLGIDSLIYSELKTVRHACSHCRLVTPVCTFFITFGFSPLPTLHLQLLLCLCLSQVMFFPKERNQSHQGLHFTATFFIYNGFSVLKTFYAYKILQLFL